MRVFMRTNSLQTEFAFVDDSSLSIKRFSKRSQGCSLPRPPFKHYWVTRQLRMAFIVYVAHKGRIGVLGQQERGGRGYF